MYVYTYVHTYIHKKHTYMYVYVTGFTKAILIGKVCSLRNTILKY